MLYYFDSSALLKLYVEESGSSQVEGLIDVAPQGATIISRLTIVEVTSALVRRSRGNDYSQKDLAHVLDLLEKDVPLFQVAEIDGATIQRAVSLVRKHGLRASDGIQLASALLARAEKRADDNFTLVSSDRELNAAASREGFVVHDPTKSE